MHAIAVLREDHDRISTLLNRLAADDPQHYELIERELTVHILAEDNIFLPQVEEAIEDSRRTTGEFFDGEVEVLDGAAEAIAEAYENHRRTRSLLDRTGPGDGIDDLKALLRRQIELEESLFPAAEQVLEDEDFERIGDLIEHCKWQVRGLAQAKLASSSGFMPAREAAVRHRD